MRPEEQGAGEEQGTIQQKNMQGAAEEHMQGAAEELWILYNIFRNGEKGFPMMCNSLGFKYIIVHENQGFFFSAFHVPLSIISFKKSHHFKTTAFL